jgi:glyoxylase-like metal-dependent hydrolase (beta-lactamase superfamily II)
LSDVVIDVARVPGGPWRENSFLLANAGKAVLIDPGGPADDIIEVLEDAGLALVAILNTHGHFDHIGAVQPLIDILGVPFYISGREVPIMKTSNMLRFIFKSKEKVTVPTSFIDLDTLPEHLQLAGLSIRCIETPGHTPGGYCFYIGAHLFSGDTVLRTMPGTAELPGGDPDALLRSLELLATLPPETILHPGHGADSTLGEALTAIAERPVRQRRTRQ